MCPICSKARVTEVTLFPMRLDCIEKAAALRTDDVKGRTADGAFDLVQSESSFLLLTHSSINSSMAGDYPFLRTGRWSEEERIFVDFLMSAFDGGILPIPGGMRLNDFLSDLLLCKNSRLTKKMKNAKLSARSYKYKPEQKVGLDAGLFSTLETRFLNSVTSEASRLELRYNMTRAWRTHFSNMCLQAGSELLNATDWVNNIENLEQRAAQAEETIRKSRRQRMGLALRTDVKAATAAPKERSNGVFISGLSVGNLEASGMTMVRSDSVATTISNSVSEEPTKPGVVTLEQDSFDNLASMENDNEDFAAVLDEFLMDPPVEKAQNGLINNSGPFLEEIVGFMESMELPFQHVDIWVPSFPPEGSSNQDEVRLCHAGHATRSDIDASLFCRLFEYGEYSSKFSFAPGVGLPGRVYSSAKHSWERSVDEADSKYFERAGGAKVYGVKTAFGLPLSTRVIGQVVLAMYSTSDLVEDSSVIEKCSGALSEYVPEPKWKLVVEMGNSTVPRSGSGPWAVKQPAPLPTGSMTAYDYSTKERPPSTTSGCSASSGSQPEGFDASPGNVNAQILPPQTSSGLNTSSVESTNAVSEEQQIANLLGEYMPLPDLLGAGESSSSVTPNALLPYFMSLRLSLLRSSDKQQPRDSELLDTIKKSYQGYTMQKNRTDREIALLLVRDWQFLEEARSQEQKPAAVATPGHVCHVMDPPRVSTYSSAGHPVTVPSTLGKEKYPFSRRPGSV